MSSSTTSRLSNGLISEIRIVHRRPSSLKCRAEECDKEAATSRQLCWKHDYLQRYWANPKYREKRKATKRAYGRWRLQVKRDIIAEALGGWKCVVCGNADRDVLTFDHKYGRGEEERRQMGGQYPSINYYYMHPDDARRKLQVLCASCNWRRNAIEHQGVGTSRSAADVRRMRRCLITLLGGPRCVCCGEVDGTVLTIDHINGGGTADRRLRGGYWPMINDYLTHPEEATRVLQVLCRNCNWKRHRKLAGVRFLAGP